MRIINQSRDASYEFDSCTMFVDDNKLYLRNNHGNGNNGVIGMYADHDEAVRVFNTIHDVYAGELKLCFVPEKGMC